MKIVIGIAGTVLLLAGGFFALNSFIYTEKQGGGDVVGGAPSPDRPAAPPAQAPASAGIRGTSWLWQRTERIDGTTAEPSDPAQFALTFGQDARVQSTTDCNTLSGEFALDGEVLSFTPFAATKMFCEGSMEGVYAEALALTNSYVIDGTTLRLNLNRDYGTMVFTRSGR